MEHGNRPLTLDQLRGMVGQPVWIENLRNPSMSQWRIVNPYHDSDVMAFSDDYYKLCSGYGKTWLSYAYHPSYIDLESWKSEWERGCVYSECKNCGYYTKVESNFCPHCGKAMDQHALDVIRNRIGG